MEVLTLNSHHIKPGCCNLVPPTPVSLNCVPLLSSAFVMGTGFPQGAVIEMSSFKINQRLVRVPVTPALWWQRQEDPEFTIQSNFRVSWDYSKTCLDYYTGSYLKT